MNTSKLPLILALFGLAACCGGAIAQAPKLAVDSGEDGTVYISPNAQSTETSVHTQGGTLGMQRPDGSGAYGGVDTSGMRNTYSAGASTGGNVSFSAGAQSDGKSNSGVKAGVTIKY